MSNDVGKASKKEDWPETPVMTRSWWYILLSLEEQGDMMAAYIADRVPGDYVEYPFHDVEFIGRSIGKSCYSMEKAGLISSVLVNPLDKKSCKIYSLTEYGRYCCTAFVTGCDEYKKPTDFFCSHASSGNVSGCAKKLTPKPAIIKPSINPVHSWLYSRPAGVSSAGCSA